MSPSPQRVFWPGPPSSCRLVPGELAAAMAHNDSEGQGSQDGALRYGSQPEGTQISLYTQEYRSVFGPNFSGEPLAASQSASQSTNPAQARQTSCSPDVLSLSGSYEDPRDSQSSINLVSLTFPDSQPAMPQSHLPPASQEGLPRPIKPKPDVDDPLTLPEHKANMSSIVNQYIENVDPAILDHPEALECTTRDQFISLVEALFTQIQAKARENSALRARLETLPLSGRESDPPATSNAPPTHRVDGETQTASSHTTDSQTQTKVESEPEPKLGPNSLSHKNGDNPKRSRSVAASADAYAVPAPPAISQTDSDVDFHEYVHADNSDVDAHFGGMLGIHGAAVDADTSPATNFKPNVDGHRHDVDTQLTATPGSRRRKERSSSKNEAMPVVDKPETPSRSLRRKRTSPTSGSKTVTFGSVEVLEASNDDSDNHSEKPVARPAASRIATPKRRRASSTNNQPESTVRLSAQLHIHDEELQLPPLYHGLKKGDIFVLMPDKIEEPVWFGLSHIDMRFNFSFIHTELQFQYMELHPSVDANPDDAGNWYFRLWNKQKVGYIQFRQMVPLKPKSEHILILRNPLVINVPPSGRGTRCCFVIPGYFYQAAVRGVQLLREYERRIGVRAD
ncbi:uncharacterized protein BJ171DRAFT_511685 [Polychytrium aggregatum]|uniref:uncharacterized protein n=1 Tax=Polychytrium aggregatum TaxID=110093 RepID=UPI0022FEE3B3|nr:uncharacterized protein BJ171DRAFT_511685 [Polychytrium aggregatum]KAI9203060.1 hypothetical protein BJ171DRAFT_511685 [Polychytrium aggregatum]